MAVLAVLILVGWEANYWPSHDFPGAYWHKENRGDDIELAQANAAKAGWNELWGYWYGPMIHGHGYYRPITSWLFVGQYRWFGTADGKWAFINIALHLAVCVLLIWAGGVITGGSVARRLTSGTATALLVGGPMLADRDIQFWICGWWPCQSEILSLLAGLTLLAATVRFVETGRGRWLALGVSAMVLGILCKEMTYVAGLGACILLVRHRKRWWGVAAIAAPAIALFVLRKWAIRNVRVEGGVPLERIMTYGWFEIDRMLGTVAAAWMHFALLAVGLAVGFLLLRRSGIVEKLIASAAVYVGVGSVLIGAPWDTLPWAGAKVPIATAAAILCLVGLVRACRRWPVPEVILIWLLCLLPVLGFPPIFGWYRYWASVFGALLIVISVGELLEWRLSPWIRASPSPTRSKLQTPTSPPPAGDGSLASGPSAA